MALDFPDNPVNLQQFDAPAPATATWQYASADNTWSVIAASGQGTVTGGDGYSWLRTVDLTSLPVSPNSWLEQELLADTDYEFDFINARPTVESSLAVQFSDNAGAGWSDGASDFGYQRVGAGEGTTVPPGTTSLNKVAWENNQDRGYIGDAQDNDYNELKAPGRHRFYIQTHDIADAQTQAIGVYNSYASGTGPYMQAMFNTRLLAFRLDNRSRFAYIDNGGVAQSWASGICRIYTRPRV